MDGELFDFWEAVWKRQEMFLLLRMELDIIWELHRIVGNNAARRPDPRLCL